MSVLERSIGWLAPPQCIICASEGLAICPDCAASRIPAFGPRCWRCGSLSERGRTCPKCQHVGGPHAVWITTDYADAAQKLIQCYKFNELRIAAEPISDLMVRTLTAYVHPVNIRQAEYLVVPVPTATSRVRRRGFDHSALLAKLIARKLGLRYAPAIGRLGQSRQLGSLRSQRLTQPADNYFIRHHGLIAGRRILLVDDVLTTGGTIVAAAQTLRRGGAHRVDALVFAKRL